ncbi:tumor necrosis factor alpha-induced protein 3-like [Branchiostoma floridae]|uniref:ubiquitinyl hydrolase 1 n=1 Tax=Branchiostoma floridae TaxID=7739 RepID=A0A9J7LSS6_BRAFL|nr:tumor necrosis factor alpha-induced protein 3-like [Branchiostoma floridae]
MVNMGSLSSANMEKAARIHHRVGLELERRNIKMNMYTSQLPQEEGGRAVHTATAGSLVDTDMTQFLMQAGIINECLTALQTIGDGNCLPHAVSLYMWGVQDKKLSLRRYLDCTMQEDGGALRERWAHQRRARDAVVPGVPIGGVDYAPGQWNGEWTTMVQMASAAPNESEPNQTRYRPLEEFHIFVLANILRRPIVVFADTSVRDDEGNSWAPIPFGGIYLPLLHTPAECVRSPILLGYNNQHFTPLLTTQTPPQNGASPSTQHPPQTISLMRQNGERLPVQYVLPKEEGRDLLAEYFNIIPADDSSDNTLLAALDITPIPDHLNLFKDLVEHETPQQRNASPDLSSFQKPVSVVRPLAKATSKRPVDNTSESMPVPCTEDLDGPQASHSPLEESFLRMKLRQGVQTATVVNSEQLRLAPTDYAAATVPPLPLQENVAILPNEENFGQSQHTIARPSGSSSVQPRASAPPLSSQGNMANPLHGADTGRLQEHVASEESQHCAGMTMQDIHSIPNDRNENSQNDGSVSAASRPSYAAAVKSNPGPLIRPSTPKPKLFSTPPRKPTCKNPECKGSPCPQNGGYCAKCHRKNSAEKRRERRESLTSRQGSTSRAGTTIHIGRAVNQKHKRKAAQPTKPNPRRPQTTSTSSLVQQRSAAQMPNQSYSPETLPSKVARASMQSTPEEPSRLTETHGRNVSSQLQVPDSVQDSNPEGICRTPGCTQLALPSADGFCVNCWSREQDAETVRVQQRQAANSSDGGSSNASKNISKQTETKAASAARGNGKSSKQRCKAPRCKGFVDDRINEALCPTCNSHLDRKNRSSVQSNSANGGVRDSNTPSPSMGTWSLGPPAGQSADRFYTQQPDGRRCLTKGCKRNGTRDNGYYCSVHAPSGNPQQGQQQFGPQSSTNNTSHQSNSYGQPPSSISSSGTMSLNFHGDIHNLHVHHHHYPSPDGSQPSGRSGFDTQSQSPFFSAPGEQQSSNLRARGSHSASRPAGSSGQSAPSGAAAPHGPQ